MITTIFYTKLTFQNWSFFLAASKEGLCFVGSSPADKQELISWLTKNYPLHSIQENAEILIPYANQLKEFLLAERTNFILPVDLKGTIFQKRVWSEVAKIPYGEIITYSSIAKNLNKPLTAQAVGSAVGKNPLLIVYPCHRVVPKNGAPKKFRGGLEMKQKLLELETRHSHKINYQ